jgi:hypothetical protein
VALWLALRTLSSPSPERSVTPLGPWSPGLTLRETFESLPTMGSEPVTARLLDDNTDAWVARWRMLAAVRDRIDTSYFILSDDVFGAAFIGHLLHKARAGVHVRLLIDGAGRRSKDTSAEPLQALAASGTAAVRIYHPMLHRMLQGFLLLRPTAALTSQHDKILTNSPVSTDNALSQAFFLDPQGAAVRDDAGRVVVAFGPRDHCAPDDRTALQLFWTSLPVAERFGFTALF